MKCSNHSTKFIITIISLLIVTLGCKSIDDDWKTTNEINTIQSYNDFLAKHQYSKYDSLAREKLFELEWNYINQNKSLENFVDFVTKYPNSKYDSLASESIIMLEWKSLKEIKSIDSLELFSSKYPNSVYLDSSEMLIEELVWGKAKEEKDTKSFQEYLLEYPDGRYANRVKKEVSQNSFKEIINALEVDFLEKLATTNNTEEYEKLINNYRNYTFVDKAVENLEKRIIQDIKINGTKDRFVFKETRSPLSYSFKGTLRSNKNRIEIYKEFPYDTDFSLRHYRQLTVNGAIPWELTQPKNGETIMRFSERVEMFVGIYGKVTIIGEGDKYNRLTFYLLNDSQLVYMRGKGRILLNNGKKISLGYN